MQFLFLQKYKINQTIKLYNWFYTLHEIIFGLIYIYLLTRHIYSFYYIILIYFFLLYLYDCHNQKKINVLCEFISYKPLLISYKPRFNFLQTPTYFLQTPFYKIILLDLFKMYISVNQPIGFSLLCFIFIYSHLLLSSLLISLDNVRSCVFLFLLFIIWYGFYLNWIM